MSITDQDTGNAAALIRMEIQREMRVLTHEISMAKSRIKSEMLNRWVWVWYRGNKRIGVVTDIFVNDSVTFEVRIKSRKSKMPNPVFLEDPEYYGLHQIGITDVKMGNT